MAPKHTNMKSILLGLSLFVYSFATAQFQRIGSEFRTTALAINDANGFQSLTVQNGNTTMVTRAMIIPIQNIEPFLAFSTSMILKQVQPLHFDVEARFANANGVWGQWEKLPEPHLAEAQGNHPSTELYFADKNSRQVELRVQVPSSAIALLDSIRFNFFAPGTKPANQPQMQGYLERPDACPCPQPNFQTRTNWNCPWGQNWQTQPSYTTVTHLVVHHSAGSNTSTDWAAVVLSIFTFHTQSNGWADIGYNWLVDPNGVLYEGRAGGNNVVGAHFCGTNGATMGTCMLGTFTSVNITEPAKQTLTNILSWKCCNSNINPLVTAFHASSNLTINTICGHRNGCATSCPGDSLFALLPTIRTLVNNRINNECPLTRILPVELVSTCVLSPNPASKSAFLQLQLKQTATVSLRLYDLSGRIVWQQDAGKRNGLLNLPIPVSRLAKGEYQLGIFVNQYAATKPLLVQ
jgi:hypothetical protein